MQSDKLYNREVYYHFYLDWAVSNISTWDEFVKKLDIGLEVIDSFELGEHNYYIVDKPKWFIAKLKYGF